MDNWGVSLISDSGSFLEFSTSSSSLLTIFKIVYFCIHEKCSIFLNNEKHSPFFIFTWSSISVNRRNSLGQLLLSSLFMDTLPRKELEGPLFFLPPFWLTSYETVFEEDELKYMVLTFEFEFEVALGPTFQIALLFYSIINALLTMIEKVEGLWSLIYTPMSFPNPFTKYHLNVFINIFQHTCKLFKLLNVLFHSFFLFKHKEGSKMVECGWSLKPFKNSKF